MASMPAPRRPGLVEDRGDDAFTSTGEPGLKRLGAFIRPYRWQLAGAILAMLAFVATQVSFPFFIRKAVDSVAGRHDSLTLDQILIGFLALIGINAVTSYLNEVTAARLAQRVIFDMRRAMFEHLQRLPLAFLDRTHVGRIMSRLQGDVNALQDFFETSITAVGDMALLCGIVVVLFAMEWRLALLTLAVIPALAFVRARWVPGARATFARARDASSIVNGALAENIAGVRVVQGARREAINLQDYKAKVDANFEAQIASSWSAQTMVPIVDILTGLAMLVIVLGGGALALDRRIDVGVMVAFIFYVQRFFDPIRTLSQQYTMLQRATAAGRRIFEVLDVPVTLQDRAQAIDLGRADPVIEFRRVTFGYRPGLPVIRALDLRIEAKEVVALVGPTGSGKTSIAALAHRFYDVWEGEVRIGGHDVCDVTLESLGRNIAIVLQEPFLFTGSVLDNIRYASEQASREDVIAAARAVRAHDFIVALPQGYDTPLDQRGQNLSLGQRQLLSFARALVADPQILILDEATASIDSFVEADIQEALRVLQRGRTSLIIAHRLATVRDADRVIVLDRGTIVEQGSPAALLAKDGIFADLYRRSFS
ncbi:ATP-binding cassette subfamily B protein [Sphingopyxis panaciterrae]|uniref:ABC transporter ATP-binding protein n=1 Tax=Sphingopyxis panaciterrae TaxID=363841 RepID=UPI0014211F45|nr:ABC transporter ATP-binding protein [Sphingopyxis panaciterrae]NIJ37362.1 ATP-binding cassette subfamily B protein [Sphingopyxis panaciterrae]